MDKSTKAKRTYEQPHRYGRSDYAGLPTRRNCVKNSHQAARVREIDWVCRADWANAKTRGILSAAHNSEIFPGPGNKHIPGSAVS